MSSYLTYHHLIQLAMTLLLMSCFRQSITMNGFGFNVDKWRQTIKSTLAFCGIYLVPVVVYNILPLWGDIRATRESLLGVDSGLFAFQFLLSGTCEEPLFRGFVIRVLQRSWSLAASCLFSIFLFMLAHMRMNLFPFDFHIDIMQQVWILCLSIYYVVVFRNTGSLLGPILAHNYSNGIIFLLMYLLKRIQHS